MTKIDGSLIQKLQDQKSEYVAGEHFTAYNAALDAAIAIVKEFMGAAGDTAFTVSESAVGSDSREGSEAAAPAQSSDAPAKQSGDLLKAVVAAIATVEPDPNYSGADVSDYFEPCVIEQIAKAAIAAMPAQQCEISVVDESDIRCDLMDHLDKELDVFSEVDDVDNFVLLNKIMKVIRPYLRTTEPVSVSLEKCVEALSPFLPQPPLYCDPPNRKLYADNCIKAAECVLTAAGVKWN